MASQLEATWKKFHPKPTQARAKPTSPTVTPSSRPVRPTAQTMTSTQTKVQPRVQEKPVPSFTTFYIDTPIGSKAVEIPNSVKDIFLNEAQVPEDNDTATVEKVQLDEVNVAHTAMLLFAGYIDAATSMSESCGGGGGSAPESGWGKKDDEDEVINRTSELRKLSGNIDKATNTWVNATLQLESAIHEYQRAEVQLGNVVNTINDKVDTINEHIDHVMEDAPTKLKVTVTVCDTDWQKMQELHAQWMEKEKQMLADQRRQQEVLWQKQSHRLTDIVRNNEGVWLSQRLFYIIGSLSLLSLITIVLEIAAYVYFHWM